MRVEGRRCLRQQALAGLHQGDLQTALPIAAQDLAERCDTLESTADDHDASGSALRRESRETPSDPITGFDRLEGEGVLDDARSTFTIVERAYERGGATILDLLDAARTSRTIQQNYFEALFNYQRNVIQLESAVGQEISL